MTWRRKMLSTVAVLVAGAIVFILYHYISKERDLSYAASCANHYIQHKVRLSIFAEENPDYILPSGDNFRTAMVEMFPNESDWYYSYGSACPESFFRNESIGYKYLGSGLNLSTALKLKQPLFLCPAENHQGATEHCHIFPHPHKGWSGCIDSNEEMVKELEYILECVNDSKYNYSEQALRTIQEELSKRKKLKD